MAQIDRLLCLTATGSQIDPVLVRARDIAAIGTERQNLNPSFFGFTRITLASGTLVHVREPVETVRQMLGLSVVAMVRGDSSPTIQMDETTQPPGRPGPARRIRRDA